MAKNAQSTTAAGDELRDYVIDILEADGSLVTREPRVNVKKVDIVLHVEDDFAPRRVAIECKNLGRTLSQGDVALIHSDFLSSLESRRFDEVWVISRLDLSPEAKNWVDDQRAFRAFTLTEFEERRHGFRKYVRQTEELFKENDLDQYFIQPRLEDGTSLKERVFEWMNGDDPHPLALLGGYGMGKTSFCRHLVDEVGKGYLADTMHRVPVYVRLSDIAKQQELEGLIAKTLAERYRVKDYHFSKFKSLNEKGKFLLIFDGFDEMKHGLSWNEFKYNFEQINRTVGGRAKVIVAGRPNAFLSDEEHSWALRGARVAGDRFLRMADWPEYVEVEMQPFSNDDARSFLGRYLRNQTRRRNGGHVPVGTDERIADRLQEFDQLRDVGGMLRPVHLKIFSDIASDDAIRLRDFNTYELYDLATDQIAEREAGKAERQPLGSDVRRRTIEDVAWWLWEESGGRARNFKPADVPLSIVRRAFPEATDLTESGMYREVFSGSFLERKHGENYFFSHRSFMEFFVARRLARSREHKLGLTSINKVMNPEVFAFMVQGGLSGAFLDYLIELVQPYSGEIELYLLEGIRRRIEERSVDVSTLQVSVQLALRYSFVYSGEAIEDMAPRLLAALLEDFASDDRTRRETALFHAADVLRTHPRAAALRDVGVQVVGACMATVNWSQHRTGIREEVAMPKLRFTRENVFEFVLLRSARIAAEMDQSGSPVLVVDAERLFNAVHELRRPKLVVAGRETTLGAEGSELRFRFPEVEAGLSRRDSAYALEVLRRGVTTRIGA